MTEFDRSKVGPLPVSDEPGSEQARLLARRRWIKGGMSAPAVLTLMSGGPAAAASNACVARPVGGAGATVADAGQLNGTVTGALDIYLRTPVYKVSVVAHTPAGESFLVYRLQASGGFGGVFAQNNVNVNIGGLNGISGLPSGPQLYGTINDTTNAVTLGGNLNPAYAGEAPAGSPVFWALLRLQVSTAGGNPTVSFVGVGPGTTGVGIAGSCWASFNP